MFRYNTIGLIHIFVLMHISVLIQVGTPRKNKGISTKGKLCKYNCDDFNQRELNQDDIHAILELNNKLRNDVASGKQAGQPPASKMKREVYDKDLARLAKEWAEKCVCETSTKNKYVSISKFPKQGQNVACFMAGPNQTPQFNRATYIWFSQGKYCPANKDNVYKGEEGCDNYRQVVNGKNFAIGCGYALCEHNKKQKVWHYVCNYGIGVSLGDTIYKTGEPGSKCRFRDDNYPNLCVPMNYS